MLLPLLPLMLSVNISQDPDSITFRDDQITLAVRKSTGSFDLNWGQNAKVLNAFGKTTLSDGRTLRSSDLANHEIKSETVRDSWGKATKVTIRHWQAGQPELHHTFWLYGSRQELIVQMTLLDPTAKGTNLLIPVMTEAKVEFKAQGPLQSLFVPYDNDNYFKFNSQGFGESQGSELGSYEVGALYDDVSRRGLIVGSIDHDTWKSAIRFWRNGGLRVQAGAVSDFTHDHDVHGTVPGPEVKSPRFVMGHYSDWRLGMERYAELNAKVRPPLEWKGPVPFGWNSWSGHKSKVQPGDADAALEFVRDDLPWLRTGGTAYINLDSFWDNFTREQRVAFVKKAHASGLKAGIYWTPFVNWGEPDWDTVGGYKFRDLQLKDSKGNLLPKHSGGWPLDPTHPGTLQRIDENIKEFLAQGFDYIKLDFTTHGAFEGDHHDPKITTGTQAYNFGMKYLVDQLDEKRIGKTFFISLSIAPLFPHGYGHSRRISCDVFSNIGASEYFLNSQNYGWWAMRHLYRFNDPDTACVYQAADEDPTTEAEARTRFTASVIGGGMMLQGDNLTNPKARERVLKIFANKEALKLAEKTPLFRPVRGDTGEKAGDLFIYEESRDVVYVAAFNFDKKRLKLDNVNLSRLGLTGIWQSRDLWSGRTETHIGSIRFLLPPTDCSLLRLTRVP